MGNEICKADIRADELTKLEKIARVIFIVAIYGSVGGLSSVADTPNIIVGIIAILSIVVAIALVIPFIEAMYKVMWKKIAADCSLTLYDNELSGQIRSRLFRSSKNLSIPLNKVDSIFTKADSLDMRRGGKRVIIVSGRSHFNLCCVQNADEFTAACMKELGRLQKSSTAVQSAPVVQNVQQLSAADELAKFKKLLDDGVITQEDFDAKKKQLLRL